MGAQASGRLQRAAGRLGAAAWGVGERLPQRAKRLPHAREVRHLTGGRLRVVTELHRRPLGARSLRHASPAPEEGQGLLFTSPPARYDAAVFVERQGQGGGRDVRLSISKERVK